MTDNTLTLLDCLQENSKHKIVLMILNQPLKPDYELLKKLWQKAVCKVAVDGGTNELYDCTQENREQYLPDKITGDFDSLRTEVRRFYESKGVEIIETEDQNYTDFTKALRCVTEKTKHLQEDQTCVIVLGAFGGRMDQVFANVDTLFQARTTTDKPIILLSHCQMAILLDKGKHKLLVGTGMEGEWCGLIPIGYPASEVTTTGLKWNLNKDPLEFGKLISTSNTFDRSCGGVVTIETNQELLWVMEIKI